MKRFVRFVITVFSLAGFSMFTGCESESESTPVLDRIAILSSNGSLLKVGESTTLSATGFDQDNLPFDISASLEWSVNNGNVSIDENGEVLGLVSGNSTITATSGEVDQTISLRVWDDDLDRIVIESSNGTLLDLNEMTTLTASGFDELGNPVDISSSVMWSSNNENVSVDQSGNVTGLMVGNSIITASVEAIEQKFALRVWDSTAPRTEIYVSDAGNFDTPPWKIMKYDENGGNPEVFIDTNLGWPQDILFLEEEVVLISNLTSGSINRYNSTSGAFIDQFATGIGGPTRMKIGLDGLLYVLQWVGNERVLRYELDGTFVDEFTAVGVNESIGLDWDTEGNLYVSSFNGGSGGYIRKFDSTGADLGLFINSNLQGPTNIWFDDNGNLLVNDWQAGRVVKFDANGTLIGNFITGLSEPEGVDFLSNGDILIGNGGNGSVKMYDPSGVFIGNLVSSGSGGLIRPNAVVLRRVNF